MYIICFNIFFFVINQLFSDCEIGYGNILRFFGRKKFAERSRFPRAAKGIGPLSQIEGISSSVNEEVPGSAFRLKAAFPSLASFHLNGR